MFKIITFLCLIFLLFNMILRILVFIVKYFSKFDRPKYQSSFQAFKDPKQYSTNYPKNTIEQLSQCDYCSVYTTSDNLIHHNGKVYCCKEHIR